MRPVRKHLQKIKSPKQLKALLKKQKMRVKVVFTNGCFDILHSGHISYLEKARNLGDLLVIGLNSDESVRRLKGPERPINSLADRLEVTSALECVDYVTWFEEDTPLELILSLHPYILVKGGDWKVDQIVGAKEVIAWGGKAKALPYIEGKSTTQIIQKARLKSSL